MRLKVFVNGINPINQRLDATEWSGGGCLMCLCVGLLNLKAPGWVMTYGPGRGKLHTRMHTHLNDEADEANRNHNHS